MSAKQDKAQSPLEEEIEAVKEESVIQGESSSIEDNKRETAVKKSIIPVKKRKLTIKDSDATTQEFPSATEEASTAVYQEKPESSVKSESKKVQVQDIEKKETTFVLRRSKRIASQARKRELGEGELHDEKPVRRSKRKRTTNTTITEEGAISETASEPKPKRQIYLRSSTASSSSTSIYNRRKINEDYDQIDEDDEDVSTEKKGASAKRKASKTLLRKRPLKIKVPNPVNQVRRLLHHQALHKSQ